MKFLLTLFAATLLSLSAFAQAPLRFNYQAVIRNSNGALVANQQLGIRISILQSSATGTAVYVERQTPTTNANGLATLDIGGGTIVSGSLATVAWGQNSFFLKTETDPVGGTNYTITSTSQLLSVPFATYATYAQSTAGYHIGELFGGGIIFSLWRDPAGVEHGLIASLNDLATRSWASPEIVSNAIGSSHDNGAVNTTAIVGQTTNSAAGLCDAYTVTQIINGTSVTFSDWYLPAAWELNLLYTQAAVINAVLLNDNNPLTNGLNSNFYWSSTNVPYSNTNTPPQRQAIGQVFTNVGGQPGRAGETHQTFNGAASRAVRRF